MRSTEIIDILKSQIKHASIPSEVEVIYLYGSAVKGRLRRDSDIDIAILTSYDVEDSERLELISKIEGVLTLLLGKYGFKQEVSILDLRGRYVSLELQYNIITEGEVIYTKDISQRFEFENAVKRDYFDFESYLTKLRKKKYGDIPQKI